MRFSRDVQKALGSLGTQMGSGGSVTLYDLTINSLTGSRLVATDASKTLISSDLTNWVAGTSNEISVSDDGNGGITIGIVDPLIVAKGGTGVASLTEGGIVLGSGTNPVTVLDQATNGQLPIGSTGNDPSLATITGTANEIIVTNGPGSITLSVGDGLSDIGGLTPSDSNFIVGDGASWITESGNTARTSLGLGTGDSPTFAGTVLSNLTANRLVASDGSKALVSSNLSSWVDGTTNQITVTDDGDGSVTIGMPDDVAISTSLTVPSVFGSSASAGGLILESTSHATNGRIFVQPNGGTVVVGSNNGSLRGSHTIGLVGPDSDVDNYPGMNLYTDTDNYPLFGFLPFSHGNVQLRFNCYYDGSLLKEIACADGPSYRVLSFDNGADDKYFSIEGYATTTQGEQFEFDSNRYGILRLDMGLSPTVNINYYGVDLDFQVFGLNDDDLIHTDAANDRVGFGVASPAEKVDIGGNLKLSGNLTDGAASLTVANAKAAYDHISSNGSDHTFIDQDVRTSAGPSFSGLTVSKTASAANSKAIQSELIFDTSGGNVSYAFGLRSTISVSGPNDVTNNVSGLAAVSRHEGTGNINQARGAYSQIQVLASGTITTGRTYHVSSPYIPDGTISTLYGLYLETQKITGVTDAYGLYQTGTNDKNYFAGNVGLGITSPSSSLAVNGASAFGDGGTTDYMEIKDTGEINLHGDARITKAIWIDAAGMKAPGANPATLIAHGPLEIATWEFSDTALEANQESVSWSSRIPTNMDRTVEPTLALAWSANGVSPGNCEWQLEYFWSGPDDSTTQSAEETLTQTDAASSTSDGMVITIVTGVNVPDSADVRLHCRVTRLSAGANDTISDTVELHGVYLQFTSDRLGEML